MNNPPGSPHKAENSENETQWLYYALWHGRDGEMLGERETRAESNKVKTRKYTYYGSGYVLVCYHSRWHACGETLPERDADFFAHALMFGHTRTYSWDLNELSLKITPDLPLEWE